MEVSNAQPVFQDRICSTHDSFHPNVRRRAVSKLHLTVLSLASVGRSAGRTASQPAFFLPRPPIPSPPPHVFNNPSFPSPLVLHPRPPCHALKRGQAMYNRSVITRGPCLSPSVPVCSLLVTSNDATAAKKVNLRK